MKYLLPPIIVSTILLLGAASLFPSHAYSCEIGSNFTESRPMFSSDKQAEGLFGFKQGEFKEADCPHATLFESQARSFDQFSSPLIYNLQPLKRGMREDEIDKLQLDSEVKSLLKETFSIPSFGSTKGLTGTQLSVRSKLEGAIRDSLVQKKGIWVPKNNEQNLLPALNEVYGWAHKNRATSEEFQEFLLKVLNQPSSAKISSYDPAFKYRFDICPDCQIIGEDGLIPFDQIEEMATPTLAGMPAAIIQKLVPQSVGLNFTEKTKQLAASTIIMTVRNRVKKDANGTYLNLPIGGFCQKKVSNHCSSFPNREGTGVYTADHCVKTLLKGYGIDPDLQKLKIGESASCSSNNPLRFVRGLNDVRLNKYVTEEDIKTCKSVTKLSEDAVFVELRDQFESLPSTIGGSIIFPNELKQSWKMEMQATQQFRRTVGFGFAHTQELVLSNGGYVANNLSCQRTFDEIAHGYQIPSHDPLKTGAGDFLCVSTDSLSGMSGGPVFSITDENQFALLGVFSFAHGSSRSSADTSECIVRSLRKIDENILQTKGAYNVISRLR